MVRARLLIAVVVIVVLAVLVFAAATDARAPPRRCRSRVSAHRSAVVKNHAVVCDLLTNRACTREGWPVQPLIDSAGQPQIYDSNATWSREAGDGGPDCGRYVSASRSARCCSSSFWAR